MTTTPSTSETSNFLKKPPADEKKSNNTFLKLHLSNYPQKDLEQIDRRFTTLFFTILCAATFPLFAFGILVDRHEIFWVLFTMWTIFQLTSANSSVPWYYFHFSTSCLFILTKLTFFTLWNLLLHGRALLLIYGLCCLGMDVYLWRWCRSDPSYWFLVTFVTYFLSTLHAFLNLFFGAYDSTLLIFTLWAFLIPSLYYLWKLKVQEEVARSKTETVNAKFVRVAGQVLGLCFLLLYTITCFLFFSPCSAGYPVWAAQWTGFLLFAHVFRELFYSTSIKFWSLFFLTSILL